VAITRPSSGNGRFLEWKIRLFLVAAVLLLVGMARDIRLLVLLSGLVLAAAFVLRFFEREPPVDEADDTDLDETNESHDDAPDGTDDADPSASATGPAAGRAGAPSQPPADPGAPSDV
jgi:hypothetical protein